MNQEYQEFWGEAILFSNYVINRGPTEGTNHITPAELWYMIKPNVGNLRTFGCISYNLVRKEIRDKFDSKAEKCIMVGYSYTPNGYRLWDIEKNKIIVARDVRFDENNFWYKNNSVEIQIEESLDMKGITENSSINIENNLRDKSIDLVQENTANENNTRENKRQIKIPAKYDDYELYWAFDAMSFVEDLPKCYEDLQYRSDRKLWEGAMNKEIEAINKNNTWI